MPPLYVVSDVHGHADDLRAGLAREGLIDTVGEWTGGDARVWLLGDFFDRGPDGIGAVDLAMSLQRQAPDHGGAVHALLGNHEVLALGMDRFGDTASSGQSFADVWQVNGGQSSDQQRLTAEHRAWLEQLPAVALEDEWLLLHSDTLDYLAWGDSITEINHGVASVLGSADEKRVFDLWSRLTTRLHFAERGTRAARAILDALGGARIVHGHTVIAMLTGQMPEETKQPLVYDEGLVTAVDGGRYAGGPLLVVRLA